MTKDLKDIYDYYSPNDLYNKIIRGLNSLEKDLSKLTLEDLHPVDEFHIRGTTATNELIALSNFTSDMHILDVGCGLGGSTRRLSRDIGCQVTGIDLSDEYIDTAIRLTSLFKMNNKAQFVKASALELPFNKNLFDGAWSIQMNMNVEDKLTWLKEVYRVVKSGSRTILYEVCGNKNAPIHYPVPWAQESTMSFLVQQNEFHKLLTLAGFKVENWNDKTDLAQKAFSQIEKPEGEPVLPKLGVHLLVGNDIKTKAYNLRRNLEEERVSLAEIVAIKP